MITRKAAQNPPTPEFKATTTSQAIENSELSIENLEYITKIPFVGITENFV